MATVTDLLTGLASCLCATLTEAERPETCFCGVLPGQTAIAEYAGDCDRDGMAWVRLITSYPAVGVGIAATNVGDCAVGTGIDVEVAVMRRYPVTVEGLDEAEALEAVQGQVDDMNLMRKAIQCCDAFGNKDYILGGYQPLGPIGDMVGGSWTVYLML